MLPSFHILCAGDYAVPFAKLCALQIEKHGADHKDLRIYIHIDGIVLHHPKELCRWFKSSNCIYPIFGCFGIKNPKKIPGHWHQIMVNSVCERFQHEDHIVFVDADNFFINGSPFETFKLPFERHTFSLSKRMRHDRRATLSHQTFSAIHTELFSLNPKLHHHINQQKYSKDMSHWNALCKMFPHADFHLDKVMDSMVSASLHAQLLGYNVHNIEDKLSTLHIGGFSHINKKKFNTSNVEQQEEWLRRFIINEKLQRLFQKLGWSDMLQPDYVNRLDGIRQHIESTQHLKDMEQKLTPDQQDDWFEGLLRQCQSS